MSAFAAAYGFGVGGGKGGDVIVYGGVGGGVGGVGGVGGGGGGAA